MDSIDKAANNRQRIDELERVNRWQAEKIMQLISERDKYKAALEQIVIDWDKADKAQLNGLATRNMNTARRALFEL